MCLGAQNRFHMALITRKDHAVIKVGLVLLATDVHKTQRKMTKQTVENVKTLNIKGDVMGGLTSTVKAELIVINRQLYVLKL